ncbi:alpha/beta hydrolase domain-containing protein [Nocardiopsis sp. CNT312]|nr:alpha/beta hydrolase domain-containing protein [Nocardiopsis sp. CNT312]
MRAPPLSRIPFHHVLNAAYDHLVDRTRDGSAPPVAPRLE